MQNTFHIFYGKVIMKGKAGAEHNIMATADEVPAVFEPQKTLVATNLSYGVKRETLMKLFSMYGGITYLNILPPGHKWNTYHVLVVYLSEAAAHAAAWSIRRNTVNGKFLNISYLWSSENYQLTLTEITDPAFVTSSEESEKRVVYMENYYAETDPVDVANELKRFGTIENFYLAAHTRPYSVRVTYKTSFSAAVAAVLAILFEDCEYELKVSLVVGKIREEPFRLVSRIEPEIRADIIDEADLQSLCYELEYDNFIARSINSEVESSYLNYLMKQPLSTEKEIFPLCRWRRDPAAVVQVLASADGKQVLIFIEIGFTLYNYGRQCSPRPGTVPCSHVLRKREDSILFDDRSAYLLKLKVQTTEECTSSRSGPGNSDQSRELEEITPLGCVLVRLEARGQMSLDGDFEDPVLMVNCSNLNYICPYILKLTDMRPRLEETIPDSMITSYALPHVTFDKKEEVKMYYRDEFHNPNLPHVSSLGVVKMTCSPARKETFDFIVVYYPSFRQPV